MNSKKNKKKDTKEDKQNKNKNKNQKTQKSTKMITIPFFNINTQIDRFKTNCTPSIHFQRKHNTEK